jgi:hypothetical protein
MMRASLRFLFGLNMKEKGSAVKRKFHLEPAECAKIAKGFPQICTCVPPARGV